MQQKENFLLKAYELGIIKFGNFTLKSGVESPFYVDLRPLSSSPQLLKTLANNLLDLVEEIREVLNFRRLIIMSENHCILFFA